MKVLVTGGSGFIGRHIVKELEGKADVTIFDNAEPDFVHSAKFCPGDITRHMVRFAHRNLGEFDVVFHCAAMLGAESTFKYAVGTEMINTLGTLHVLEGFPNAIIIRPGLLGRWLNPYMISTQAALDYGFAYRKYLDRKFAAVRYTVVYGPYQVNGIVQIKAVPVFIDKALKDEPIEIYGDGSYKVRLLYVSDAAKATIKVAENYDKLPESVDITSLREENFISVKGLAELIIELTGSSSSIVYVPMRKGQPEDAKDAGVNVEAAKKVSYIIGFKEQTDLRTGLMNTINWMRR